VSGKIEVGVYYFPNWHPDPRNEAWLGTGWTEWELMKIAKARFPGHYQPIVPLWGYEDESRPEAAEKKINAAADNGLDAFIFDWYWYEDGPYLERALEQGFLQAKNNDRLKFAIMWANHDLSNIFPAHRSNPHGALVPGAVSAKAFKDATDHIINVYFSHPSYWKVGGRHYFSMFEVMTLINGLGDVASTREALDDFRDRARKAGVGEIHLNAVTVGVSVNQKSIHERNELVTKLGFDSVTSYVWVHHAPFAGFPFSPYSAMLDESEKVWDMFTTHFSVPYYPNVTMGWDSSPRTTQSDTWEDWKKGQAEESGRAMWDAFDRFGYPMAPVLENNTPREFQKALLTAKSFVETQPIEPKILTINAWNEWSEGCYLEPDTANGMAYLEAVREVFGKP